MLILTGSSPRMRGSLLLNSSFGVLYGIIPAHAGLTFSHLWPQHSLRDHPRACGAHQAHEGRKSNGEGSSPRMRGSQARIPVHAPCEGIIPAHAGLTAPVVFPLRLFRDHPRACGAHILFFGVQCLVEESSPRMRGSPTYRLESISCHGIIPAHAGLTPKSNPGRRRSRDHPRACGAHCEDGRAHDLFQGSSPRMRGSPPVMMPLAVSQGIIPAHAGLTSSRQGSLPQSRDHPRACGAH